MFLTRNALTVLLATALAFAQSFCIAQKVQKSPFKASSGLKDAYLNYFSIGVAITPNDLKGKQATFIKRHFNSITAENAMKMAAIQPKEDFFNWAAADSIVDFAIKNKINVRGHTLVWHDHMPSWFFIGPDGKQVSKELLLTRLQKYITAVMTRYKGKIYAWDVVNEAVDDEPKNYLRKSKWYEIIGEDFIAKAFEYAHAADPEAQLFYNDYNADRPDKRENIYKLLKNLKDKGVPIHGIGLQSHWNIYEVNEVDLKAAIEKYASLGLKLHFTEVDMSIYPWELVPRNKREGENETFTVELAKQQADKYEMVFRVFRQYKTVIENVTFWNVSDRYTWLDDYPVRGRKNYPLLFDAKLNPKPAYWKVVNFKDK